ncbi:TPA: ImmA/IrrE family metallo-endopeptidase [Streptococcus suis]|nr:ImmA/IrrE family metallo-endopeptidase [Streptococcus suis]HEM6296505.1 ImmA/IrrE family metallo-endopeptidase [Streptococcus suis]
MPITEYIKRKFINQIKSDIHSNILLDIKAKIETSVESWQVYSKELPNIKYIKVTPFQKDYRTIRLLVNVTSETHFEFICKEKTEIRDIQRKHTIEYLLFFDDEVIMSLVEIGELRKVKFDSETQLDSTLLPYMYQTKYEEEAEQFLNTFYSSALKLPQPIDPLIAINRLGLTLLESPLSPDGSIRGQSHFRSEIARVYDHTYNSYKSLVVSEGTVIYDASKFVKGNKNLTLIHEAYHHYRHRPHIMMKEFLLSQDDYKSRDKDFKNARKWIEKQAKVVPPRILMPRSTFCKKALELITEIAEHNKRTGMLDILQITIEELADFFHVSKQSARVRLIELGFDEVRGVLEFVDGRYVNNYAFNKLKVNHNQTLTVSEQQMFDLYASDSNFRELIDSKRYIYVDGHVVINSPEVVWYFIKYPLISPAALEKLDEYAIIFDIKRKEYEEMGFEEDFTLYLLHPSSYKFEISYKHGIEYSIDERKLEVETEQRNREFTLFKQLPNDFTEAMNKVKDYQEETFPKIAEAVDSSESTIKRLFKGTGGNLHLFVLVLVYLELPDFINQYLLSLSNFKIKNGDKEDMAYQYLLNYFQGQSVAAAKQFLTKRGISTK